MSDQRRFQLADQLAAVLARVDREFNSARRNTVNEAPRERTVVEISIPLRKAVADVLEKWKNANETVAS